MILSIFGPTASGKSSLALRLAQDLHAEIVNCDSVQLYEGFKIGAAQPSEEEKQLVAHHLFEVIPPNQEMSVGRYRKLADQKIKEIQQKNKLPIIVGGTSLYLTALLHGLADIDQDSAVRAKLDLIGNDALHAELSAEDPEAAKKIHPHDRQRLLRAIESLRLGKKISQSHLEHQSQKVVQDCLIIVPLWERDALYKRIDQRTQKMFEEGLVKEAQSLAQAFPSADPLGSIGYKEVLAAKDVSDVSVLVEEVAQNTRRFAKRQLTWLRNEPEKRSWSIRPGANEPSIAMVGQLQRFAKPSRLKHIPCLDWEYDTLRQEVVDFLQKDDKKGIFIWFVPAQKVV